MPQQSSATNCVMPCRVGPLAGETRSTNLSDNVVPIRVIFIGALQVAGVDVPRLMLLLAEQDDPVEVEGQAIVVPVACLQCKGGSHHLMLSCIYHARGNRWTSNCVSGQPMPCNSRNMGGKGAEGACQKIPAITVAHARINFQSMCP